jgi:hypothetical protein
MLSAFLSVAFSCKHQRFIGNLLLAKDLWEFKKFLHDGSKGGAAKPQLGVVLLLSGTKMFFDLSLMLYTVGLGVYLGCVWQGGVDTDAGQTDSRNIFVWFLIFLFLYSSVYVALDSLTNTGRLQGWMCHLKWYQDKRFPPCVGETCCRQICSPDDPGKEVVAENVTGKQPLLLRMLLFWCPPSRSQCNGSCLRQTCELTSGPLSSRPSALEQRPEISIIQMSLQDPQRFETTIPGRDGIMDC